MLVQCMATLDTTSIAGYNMDVFRVGIMHGNFRHYKYCRLYGCVSC